MKRILFLLAILPAFLPVQAAAQAPSIREEVESAARDQALARVVAPDEFQISSVRFGGADPHPEGRRTLELLDVQGPGESGLVRMRFAILVDGRPSGQARATVRGVVRGPALVATRTLVHGRAIPLDALELQVVDLTRHGTPLRDPLEVGNRVPLRSLGAGRILSARVLAPMPVVRRGDTVNLTYRSGSLLVTTKASVRRDAIPGERITAENLRTGKRVLALVQDDGSLQLLRGAVAGRR